jgi:hypothetical protein
MVPVQPRWDGPQDLVGFYNYLEKRFKATELARALVRLDGEGWPEFRNSVDDHVVLVLFDEMNLAHVEYYFSDFLSLLEIRRADPRRATIEIDLGLERRFVRLVENMLFVGTMNEDETTQTLSDKVLDRANLLRFARPRMFGETAPAAAEGARKGWLSAKVWKSWQREPSELDAGGHRNQLDSWIATLNDALDRVGRPFGHRVQQALLAYAANHPGVLSRETPVAEAFVDQLEQRILPKLRGVDPQADDVRGGLDDIERLLRSDEDLRDDALLAALERARSQDLFVWSGVQRDT